MWRSCSIVHAEVKFGIHGARGRALQLGEPAKHGLASVLEIVVAVQQVDVVCDVFLPDTPSMLATPKYSTPGAVRSGLHAKPSSPGQSQAWYVPLLGAEARLGLFQLGDLLL